MRKISYRFVYNRKKSLNDRGTALVQVEAYLNKKKVYFSTHVYLRPEQWDVKRKIIKDHPNQDALNGMLNEFIIELEKKELSLWRQGKTITLSLIKEEFKSNTDASFLGFARKEIMSSQLKDSTKRNHLTTISLLQSFKPTIEFEDLTYNFVTDFEKFLYESGYQTNTVAKHMKHLKSFVNAAINKGYIDPNNYAFRRYKIKMKEGKHVFLLPEEMKKLEEVSLTGRNSCLEHTLDAFLFCCYTGLAYADVYSLTTKEIVTGKEGKQWIVKARTKTHSLCNIPLLKPAIQILERYADFAKAEGRLLPVPANQTMNDGLKEIAELCGINKQLTTHCARHTFATTVTLANNVSIENVSQMLGHSNIKMTQHYAKVLNTSISRDMEKVEAELSL